MLSEPESLGSGSGAGPDRAARHDIDIAQGMRWTGNQPLDELLEIQGRILQIWVSSELGEPLWLTIRSSVQTFLLTLWRNVHLEGRTPDEAFFVRCDTTTMTRDDIEQGIVIIRLALKAR
jgi:phage tail sheath protein FI